MAESPQWPASRVRQTYIDFFAERGHTVGEFNRPPLPCRYCLLLRYSGTTIVFTHTLPLPPIFGHRL